ncbi:MAG: hypothetical protein ABJB74_03985 [Gemmatimonas sp.]
MISSVFTDSSQSGDVVRFNNLNQLFGLQRVSMYKNQIISVQDVYRP